MMKEHRATRTRALGGSAALAAVMVAGLAVSSPGFAREEVAVPKVLLASAAAADPIISARDIATLRQRCGDSERRGVVLDSQEEGGTIVCGNGRRIRDPEVRAIVAKAVEGAERKLDAAEADLARTRLDAKQLKLDPESAAEVREAVAEAQAAVRHIVVEDRTHRTRMALDQARAELSRMDIQAIKTAALASALAHARVEHAVAHAARPRIRVKLVTPEMNAEIQRALADARAGLEVDLDAILDEADVELDRELDRELGDELGRELGRTH